MSEQQPVLSREECVEHNEFWMSDGREHAWTCTKCGYARDSMGSEVLATLICLTPPTGLPDGLYRCWAPTFPLVYL